MFSFNASRSISNTKLIADAVSVSKRLPDHGYVINLCQDRYNFSVALLATIKKRQHTLLPPNSKTAVLREIIQEHPNCYYLYDKEESDINIPGFKFERNSTEGNESELTLPDISDEAEICSVFTSGSTGKPAANIKTWGSLKASTHMALSSFALGKEIDHQIVCTVPPQHMYGLETSIFYPLFGNVAVHSGKPFFPEDIREALVDAHKNRVLITTPIHLKACVNSQLKWPEIDLIISATAPLSKALANSAEACFSTEVKEIFGCTEAGSIASRRTTRSDAWVLFNHIQLTTDSTGNNQITGPQLEHPVILQDKVSLLSPTSFKLIGRHSDMVNIAGKRGSIADLNKKLNAIPGVVDGVYLSQKNDEEMTRLSALVVAPYLNEDDIIGQLRKVLDPVFLPRPLLKVNSLPRNETGKLPEKDLLECFEQACLA